VHDTPSISVALKKRSSMDGGPTISLPADATYVSTLETLTQQIVD